MDTARKLDGRPAFRQGLKASAGHWPIDVSMSATVGIGYREIWEPVLTDKSVRIDAMRAERTRLGTPTLDAPFSDNFGKRMERLDISSLHVAFQGDLFCAHIDRAGFTMRALPGMSTDVTVAPDALPHALVELGWKDILKKPDWMDLVVPETQHSRAGVQFNVHQSDKMNLTVSATCGMNGRFNCSGTVSLFGRHHLWGSK